MSLNNDLNHEDLTNTLTENFKILADQVQLLNDRNTILEQKLRFANESFQGLADKYAIIQPEISSIVSQIQLPLDLNDSDRAGVVPLPLRAASTSKDQTSAAIRDGRRAIQRLVVLGRISKSSTASGKSISGTSSNRFSTRRTSSCLSTVLEQDFTVPGKKSSLLCPYAAQIDAVKPATDTQYSQGGGTMDSDRLLTPSDSKDPTPHRSADPICAAMYAETMNSPPPSVTGPATKCPIRYLDQHSPEEVARYFETHKHEIPRSHEICVKRYQRNEDDIRKLDAKYGNLVSMIQGLGQKHQPMLPAKEETERVEDDEHMSNERVENWAQAVSADGINEDVGSAPSIHEDDRESRFDRPLKEIRVGESPSRPWGISVPVLDPPSEQRAISPPPAPVSAGHIPKSSAKCPFGFDQEPKLEDASTHLNVAPSEVVKSTAKCPFPHEQKASQNEPQEPLPGPRASPGPQPMFDEPEVAKGGGRAPQMIFTGPVFIGYPVDQAVALMQQWKNMQ
ncbi:hypothetical protein B0O99DRAFT_587877 [Bisporella sp. PMI_857]|nr:hypothetical protein B0O99DRAFT_587877 [Bisporella sp. PMI_857]